MKTLRSSWNSDRIAAAVCSRRPARKTEHRPPALYAQLNVKSNVVSVFTRRGREVFSRRFDDAVYSACIVGNSLQVEMVDGGRYLFDAWSGDLLTAEVSPKPPAGDLPSAARPELAVRVERSHAA